MILNHIWPWSRIRELEAMNAELHEMLDKRWFERGKLFAEIAVLRASNTRLADALEAAKAREARTSDRDPVTGRWAKRAAAL